MNVTLRVEDVQFYERDFREHHNRIEAAFYCDGVPCEAAGAPHSPVTPHFHHVFYAPDLRRERLVYVDPEI